MEVDQGDDCSHSDENRGTVGEEDGEEGEEMPPSPTRMPGGLARGK